MGSSAQPPPDIVAKVVRNERVVVAAALALLLALSWWFLVSGAGMEAEVAGMPPMQPTISALVVMWWLMMVAMMVPSAAPAILLYIRVRQQRNDPAIAGAGMFLLGYLLAWFAFSVVAALLQRTFAGADMRLGGTVAAALVVIAAGIYQLTPLKAACLRRCRSPAQFLSVHWRPHAAGAVRLGVLHGMHCVGCCWLLMALLFVGGVMNLLLVVALSVLVAAEKLVPQGYWIGRAAGIGLLLWGASKALG